MRAAHVAHAVNRRGDTVHGYRVGSQAGGPGTEGIGVEHHALNVGRQPGSEYGDQAARREGADPGGPAGVIEAAVGDGRARGNDGEREYLGEGSDEGSDGHGTGSGSGRHGDSRQAGGIGEHGERGDYRRAASHREADRLVRHGQAVGADDLDSQRRWEALSLRRGLRVAAGHLVQLRDLDVAEEGESGRDAVVVPGESSPDGNLSGRSGRESDDRFRLALGIAGGQSRVDGRRAGDNRPCHVLIGDGHIARGIGDLDDKGIGRLAGNHALIVAANHGDLAGSDGGHD